MNARTSSMLVASGVAIAAFLVIDAIAQRDPAPLAHASGEARVHAFEASKASTGTLTWWHDVALAEGAGYQRLEASVPLAVEVCPPAKEESLARGLLRVESRILVNARELAADLVDVQYAVALAQGACERLLSMSSPDPLAEAHRRLDPSAFLAQGTNSFELRVEMSLLPEVVGPGVVRVTGGPLRVALSEPEHAGLRGLALVGALGVALLAGAGGAGVARILPRAR